jgi:hypothetical protein
LASSVNRLHNDKVELTHENEELKLTITRLLLQLRGHRRRRLWTIESNEARTWRDQEHGLWREAVAEAEKIVQEYTSAADA